MIHARKDYNRIQDPAVNDPALLSEGSNPIAADEPVFLIRAKDSAAPATVRAWADENIRKGGDPRLSHLAHKHALRMEEWQVANGRKQADAPESVFEEK